MSVITKASPLNLMGRVAIVTSASTPLGAQTCRTLLKHNALVIGITSPSAEPVTEAKHRLFTAMNTHFQTLVLDLADSTEDVVARMVEHVRERYWKDGFDVLVTFGEDVEGEEKVRGQVAEVMKGGRGGVLLNVVRGEGKEGRAKDVAALAKESGVRANVVLVDKYAGKGGDGLTVLDVPAGAIQEVKEVVEKFRGITEADTDTDKGNRGLADLLLYLSTAELGGPINGAVVTADGGWNSL